MIRAAGPKDARAVVTSDREAQVLALRHDADGHAPGRVRLDCTPPNRERLRLDVGGELAGATEHDLARAALLRGPRDREEDVVRGEYERNDGLSVLLGEVDDGGEDRLLVGREVRVVPGRDQVALDFHSRHDHVDVLVLGFTERAVEVAEVPRVPHGDYLAPRPDGEDLGP